MKSREKQTADVSVGRVNAPWLRRVSQMHSAFWMRTFRHPTKHLRLRSLRTRASLGRCLGCSVPGAPAFVGLTKQVRPLGHPKPAVLLLDFVFRCEGRLRL